MTNFVFLGSKMTMDSDCSHEIKRHLLLGRKALTNPDSVLKSRDTTLSTKVHIVKAMVFPLALFLVRLPKTHLTSPFRMSGSRWVTTPLWLSGSLSVFLYSLSGYIHSKLAHGTTCTAKNLGRAHFHFWEDSDCSSRQNYPSPQRELFSGYFNQYQVTYVLKS